MPLTTCRECGQTVSTEARSCPHCGAPSPSRVPPPFHHAGAAGYAPGPQVVYVERKQPSGGIAAVLSFIVPGLGQLYKGQIGRGLLWFFLTIIGYAALVVPGLILHLCCIINAASTDAS